MMLKLFMIGSMLILHYLPKKKQPKRKKKMQGKRIKKVRTKMLQKKIKRKRVKKEEKVMKMEEMDQLLRLELVN